MRLVQVALPGGATIDYTYDMEGRLLTRMISAGTTKFEWAGFDFLREVAEPTGVAVYDTATFDSSAEGGRVG